MMIDYKTNQNKVSLSGVILDDPVFDHEAHDEKFYTFRIQVKRYSGALDIIPVRTSERVLEQPTYKGQRVNLSGQYRSYNAQGEEHSRLLLFVFATSITLAAEDVYASVNQVVIDGFFCRTPVYRTTPLGREICDVMVACNYATGKTAYLPCVIWGRNARYAYKSEAGAKVQIEGRIQSREYKKMINGVEETRVAYEISVSKINIL